MSKREREWKRWNERQRKVEWVSFIFSLEDIHQNSRMNMDFSCSRHEATFTLSFPRQKKKDEVEIKLTPNFSGIFTKNQVNFFIGFASACCKVKKLCSQSLLARSTWKSLEGKGRNNYNSNSNLKRQRVSGHVRLIKNASMASFAVWPPFVLLSYLLFWPRK